jgi:hypothetical protein
MYDFLNNFHKRMEKLSYSFLIDNKVSTGNTFKENFDSTELINIVYTLMCYVLDKSLKDEECTLKNMSSFLDELIERYYNKDLEYEEIEKITKYIVYKILRNNGQPFIFTTIDYSNNNKIDFRYHLLQQKTSKSDSNKSTFYLTQEGYRLILGALEVDEKTQVDINQMILELSLKKKNFSQGLMAVENLSNLITSQINVLNNFIYKTRENIFSLDQKDFEKNFLTNIEVLKEQSKKFDELKNTITCEQDRISKSQKGISEDEFESLKQLGRIKKLLVDISFKAGDLISKHFQFKSEYIKALEEASYYYSSRKINIKEDIIKPFENTPDTIYDLYKLFNPLFKSNIPKKFNINYMFNDQNLYVREEDDKDIIIETIEEDQIQLEQKKKSREEYKGVVSSLLEFIINKKSTDLKDLIENYENKSNEKYTKLVPSIRKFSKVLIELLRIGDIDIEAMINDQEEAYDNEEVEFDLRKMLVDEINDKYQYMNFKTMSFYKSDDNKTLQIKEQFNKELEDDFATIEVLNCPNINMVIE